MATNGHTAERALTEYIASIITDASIDEDELLAALLGGGGITMIPETDDDLALLVWPANEESSCPRVYLCTALIIGEVGEAEDLKVDYDATPDGRRRVYQLDGNVVLYAQPRKVSDRTIEDGMSSWLLKIVTELGGAFLAGYAARAEACTCRGQLAA